MNHNTILVTGVNGQVGFELVRSLQGLGLIVPMDRSALDLSDPAKIIDVIERVRPTLIVNPAAYTAVDKAETEPEGAYAINAVAPGILAQQAARFDIPLIHYSTDYVFNGEKQGAYVETDVTDPQNEYGRSKLAGEQAIAASGCAHLILRTSWVYGANGTNFVKTMLRLGRERDVVTVVDDQRGSPTWSRTLADLTAHIVSQSSMTPSSSEASARIDWWRERSGIYHLSGGGETHWANFAETIFKFSETKCHVEPIPSYRHPTQAKRPQNSCMSNDKLARVFGLRAPQWQASLRLFVDGI